MGKRKARTATLSPDLQVTRGRVHRRFPTVRGITDGSFRTATYSSARRIYGTHYLWIV